LFIADTSVFVTSSGVNPTLTAMALADRSAAFIAEAAQRGNL
jgi:choline dehydrogenase-like flavoprotein